MNTQHPKSEKRRRNIQSYFAEFSDGGEDYESGEEAFGERESEEYYRELEREAERRRKSAWER